MLSNQLNAQARGDLLSKSYISLCSHTDLKLLTALVVAVFLAVPYWKGRYFTKPVRKEGAPHA